MDFADSEIVKEIRGGNRQAFEKVFKKYYPLLCLEAKGYMKSDILIEEIVCDVFTRIWINRESLNITTSLRDYLVRAVHNNSIDYYRQMKRLEVHTAQKQESDEESFTLMDLGESPLDYILGKELEEKILQLIDSLPPQYQKAFKLSRFKDKTYEEIADIMQISVNSVKTNIKNALAFLRKELTTFFLLAGILAGLQKIFF